MYKVLSKDIIENEVLPYLATAKRGFKTKSCLVEVINSILYKLKTGIQWHMLPVSSLFSDVVLSYKTVYWHLRKWSKSGNWEGSWLEILSNHKYLRDNQGLPIAMSSHVSGNHHDLYRIEDHLDELFQTFENASCQCRCRV